MIELVTLLLGLVTGPHPVEVAVGPEVHAVYWILDGESVAARSEPPWRATIQFGAELRPHRLTAVALDRTGVPIGRAEQLVNYIRSSHEVVVVLESERVASPEPAPRSEADGPVTGDGSVKSLPRRGYLVTKGVLGHRPTEIQLLFDDRPLPVKDGAFELPDYDRDRPHAIRAEVTFSDGVTAETETTFGGGIGEEVTSALTAVAVTGRKGRPWTKEEVEGWLRKSGRPLDVFQTRADGGRVVIVRDESLDMALLRSLPLPSGAQGRSQGRREYELWAVSTVPIPEPNVTFRESALGRVLSDEGLLLSLVSPPESYGFAEVVGGEADVWGALAVAGRSAASSNQPRVVVLLLGPETPAGNLRPETVLRYLESIHVPVLIWALGRKPLKELGLHKMPNAYFGPSGLGSVVEKASAWIDSQTVVWVEGEHLPTEVELRADRKKAQFAGRTERR